MMDMKRKASLLESGKLHFSHNKCASNQKEEPSHKAKVMLNVDTKPEEKT
jgi:hypothetical protein